MIVSGSIKLSEVLVLGKRLVITGGPGCGKTTVLMHIAWALAVALAYDNSTIAQEKLTLQPPFPLPIFLPINRYANHLRKDQKIAKERTLAAFIAEYLHERQKEAPTDFFQQLLKQGKHVILLLDGLDEVPSEQERVQVTQAIEDLVAAYSELRVIVTCRTAAYKDRIALGQNFREVKVLPLDEESLTQLIRQAYRAVEPDNEARQKELAQELLDGITQMERERRRRLGDNAEKLVNTPLLVRMLLLVHLSERRLPEQRAELYSKAIDNMILPDYSRDAAVRDEIGALVGDKIQHLELIQFIAFEMHQEGETQGREIDEPELKRLFQKEPKLVELVDQYIATTRQRGTLMEERLGTYRFLHLGFQEFLVARYMVEALWFEHKLPEFIKQTDCLTDSWWREPLLLLGGYLSITFARQAERYVRYLAGIDGRSLGTISQTEQWAGAELAATVLLEWPTAADTLKKAVAQRMADLILVEDTSEIPAQLRANLGMALGRLGDPRPGVGVKDELPDIVWGEVVPAGKYTIGGDKAAPRSFELQEIEIEHPYQLAIYPVTAVQFQCFLDADDMKDLRWWAGMPENQVNIAEQRFDYPNHPRDTVTWYQATAFCRWLSDKTGNNIHLPHEYHWEVAARFNDTRKYPWGEVFDWKHANTATDYINSTVAVGLYPQGRNLNLGLYEMAGNVDEWCCNKYRNPEEKVVDSTNDWRVLRGGSYSVGVNYVRTASRHHFRSPLDPGDIGFRLCVTFPPH